MTSTAKAFVAGSVAIVAAVAAAPAMARDPYDRAHGFGLDDPYARSSIDRCADAAEDRASRFGPARVVRITNVDRQRRGFVVSGAIAVDHRWGGWRHRDRRDTGWFKCRTEFGRVVDLRLDGVGRR